MSTLLHPDSTSTLSPTARPASGLRGLLRALWQSYARHSELQVLLASGHGADVAQRDAAHGGFAQRRVTIPLR